MFHTLKSRQPGNLSTPVFDFLTGIELPDLISTSATRIDNPDTGDWCIAWLFRQPVTPVDAAAMINTAATNIGLQDQIHLDPKNISSTDVPDRNWLEHSYQGFMPFTIGRFAMRGQHHMEVEVPKDHFKIIIDAVTAFGSGEHPTTRGCLLMLDHLAQEGKNPTRILDLGTGSGILAIAAHRLWPEASITAVDIDPESVRVAAEYAGYNKVPLATATESAGRMRCVLADTPTADDVARHGPFDLVISNILAGPLRELAPAIANVTAPGGVVVLSGLLDIQMDEVVASYIAQGLTLTGQEILDDWAVLRVEK